MSFKLNCPYCRQRLEAEDEWIGLEVPCPNCSRDFAVMRPGAAPAAPASCGATPPPVSTTGPTRPCPYCGEAILQVARKCKHCGEFLDGTAKQPASVPGCAPKPEKRRSHPLAVGCLTIIIFLGVIAVIQSSGLLSTLPSTEPTSPGGSTPAHRPPPAPAEPKLLLLNWNWHDEYGYAIAEGEVQNISSESLHSVAAVATFYTADKKFITTGEALVGLNPILPGQTSAFKTMATHNPAMDSATITFKELFGGAIPWKKKQ